MNAHYVTFEQAKLLKEKGFNVDVKYNNYCTGKSFYKNEELFEDEDVSYGSMSMFENLIAAPEQWQVVEWLRVNHGIWICIDKACDIADWKFNIRILKSIGYDFGGDGFNFNTPQAACSAAIDHVLKNII